MGFTVNDVRARKGCQLSVEAQANDWLHSCIGKRQQEQYEEGLDNVAIKSAAKRRNVLGPTADPLAMYEPEEESAIG